jgi:hypothetical protein
MTRFNLSTSRTTFDTQSINIAASMRPLIGSFTAA